MRTLIFGCGWLGMRLAKANPSWLITAADIASRSEVRSVLAEVKPDVVINAAAKCGSPNIDACLDMREAVARSNVKGPFTLGRACADEGIHLVHISSGCLWASGTGYTPDSVPEPPSFYSETKAQAEKVLHTLDNLELTMVRMRMPLDDRPHPRNLISKLLRYPKIINEPCSLTTVPLFVDVMTEIVEKRITGTYHVVQKGATTNAEILAAYAEATGHEHQYEIITEQELKEQGLIREKRSFAVLEPSLGVFHTPFLPAKQAVQKAFKNYAKLIK